MKAYKPTVDAAFVFEELAFEDEEEGVLFLRKCGCVLEPAPNTAAAIAKAERLAAVATAAAREKKTPKHSKKRDATAAMVEAEAEEDYTTLEINTKDSMVDVTAIFTQENLLL